MSLTPRLDRLDKNFIINGGFNFWQRNTTFSAAGYTADRFRAEVAAGTFVASRSSTVPDAQSPYSISMAGTSSTNPQIAQRIESIFARKLAGKTVTLQVKSRSEDATESPIKVIFRYANSVDAFSSTTDIQTSTLVAAPVEDAWNTSIVSVAIPAGAANGLEVVIYRESTTTSTTTLYTQIMLSVGEYTEAREFVEAGGDYVNELHLCQRYYEKGGYSLDQAPGTAGVGAAANTVATGTGVGALDANWYFKVEKRATPTVNVYNPVTGTINQWAGTGTPAASAGTNSTGNIRIINTGTTTGSANYAIAATADAEL